MCPTPESHVHDGERCQTEQVEALIQAYAPLVKYLAQRLACRLPASVCLEDLISAGVLGLLDAIAKYDPTRGTTFKTYAEWRMRAAMLAELRAGDWVPRSVRAQARALTHASAALARQHGRPAADEDVAAFVGVERAPVAAWLPEVRGVSCLSLARPLALDTAGHTATPLARLAAAAPAPLQSAEAEGLKRHLAAAIDQLPEREKGVLSLYYYEALTMHEIGQVLELTVSRISQIHTKAILHLRAALQHLTPDASAFAA